MVNSMLKTNKTAQNMPTRNEQQPKKKLKKSKPKINIYIIFMQQQKKHMQLCFSS
jgi:hypothetical protein